jgi:hypothetical protein
MVVRSSTMGALCTLLLVLLWLQTSVGVHNSLPVKAALKHVPNGQVSAIRNTFAPDDSEPTSLPTSQPTLQPSSTPTVAPTVLPSSTPSTSPTSPPSVQPSARPSALPSSQPSAQPTARPTSASSLEPTSEPTAQPSAQPTSTPTFISTIQPTSQPTSQPTTQPTKFSSTEPSAQPSSQPTSRPTSAPSSAPTAQPSNQPTGQPTVQPSKQPVSAPTSQPSAQPSSSPSVQPTSMPSPFGTMGEDWWYVVTARCDFEGTTFRSSSSTTMVQAVIHAFSSVLTNALNEADKEGVEVSAVLITDSDAERDNGRVQKSFHSLSRPFAQLGRAQAGNARNHFANELEVWYQDSIAASVRPVSRPAAVAAVQNTQRRLEDMELRAYRIEAWCPDHEVADKVRDHLCVALGMYVAGAARLTPALRYRPQQLSAPSPCSLEVRTAHKTNCCCTPGL